MRTRMAPSPTGEFHIGGMRTLLYSYALGKKDGGQFILRIEDTDKKREVEGTLERIKQVISDYGLSWDEYYKQSERLDIYQKHAKELVESGNAYYCFCSEEKLEQMRDSQKQKGLPVTKYDGTCRDIDTADALSRIEKGVPHVIRLKVPKNETILFKDAILGEIKFQSNDLEDLVLLKSDGYPTYHLAVVIDDHLMNISHVLRGHEWLPSAPRHVLLYKAFGWEIPVHAHLPNLKDKGSTKKLSKRFGDVHATAFLEKGYLPEALLNFLMFLGWNPGGEQEIFSLSEFIEKFSLDRVHKTDLVVFDREKLLWYNGHYIRALSTEDLYKRIKSWSTKYKVTLVSQNFSDDYNISVLKLVQERMKTLADYNDLVDYFYKTPEVLETSYLTYVSEVSKVKEILLGFYELLKKESNWEHDHLKDICFSYIKEKGYTNKEALMTMRIALTGKDATPQIFDMLIVLGKEVILSRINTALGN